MNRLKKTRVPINLLRIKQSADIIDQLNEIAQFANLANKYFKIENPAKTVSLTKQTEQKNQLLTERIKQQIQEKKESIEKRKQGIHRKQESQMFITQEQQLIHNETQDFRPPKLNKRKILEQDYKDVQVILCEEQPNEKSTVLFEKFQNNLQVLKKGERKNNFQRASMFHRTFAFLLRKMKSKSSEVAGSNDQIIYTEENQEETKHPRHIELLNKYLEYETKNKKRSRLSMLVHLNNQTQLNQREQSQSSRTVKEVSTIKPLPRSLNKIKPRVYEKNESQESFQTVGNQERQEFLKSLMKIKEMTNVNKNTADPDPSIQTLIKLKRKKQNAQNVEDKQKILLNEDDFLYQGGHKQIEEVHGTVFKNFGYENNKIIQKKKEKLLKPLMTILPKVDSSQHERSYSLADQPLDYSAYQKIKKSIKLIQLNSKKYVQKLDSFQLENLKQKLSLN